MIKLKSNKPARTPLKVSLSQLYNRQLNIWYVNEHSEVGYWCDSYIDVIRGYLKELQSLCESTKYSNNELKRSYLYLRQMGTSGRDCSVIRQVQFPSGYVLHLEMFIGLWISVLPFGLVERSGQSSPGTPRGSAKGVEMLSQAHGRSRTGGPVSGTGENGWVPV